MFYERVDVLRVKGLITRMCNVLQKAFRVRLPAVSAIMATYTERLYSVSGQ